MVFTPTWSRMCERTVNIKTLIRSIGNGKKRILQLQKDKILESVSFLKSLVTHIMFIKGVNKE